MLDADCDYLIIVTNKELGASRGTALESIYPQGTLAYPAPQTEHFLPLKRVYVLSIEDFERLVSAEADGSISIPEFLASCVSDDEAPETQVMLFEQHLNRQKVQLKLSPVVDNALKESMSRIEKAMKP